MTEPPVETKVPTYEYQMHQMHQHQHPYFHITQALENPEVEIKTSAAGPDMPPAITPETETEVQIDSERERIEQWDIDETWPTRLWQRIMEERKQRQQEILLIQQMKHELEEEKQQIAQTRHDLEVRESQFADTLLQFDNRYCDILCLLPSLKELQSLGLDPHQILTWVETIRFVADIRKTDIKTASYCLKEDLSRELGFLQKTLGQTQQQIQQAQQKLTVLNITYADKQGAIQILTALLQKGVTMEEIYGLSMLQKMGRQSPGMEWQPPGMQFGNGGNGNGNSSFCKSNIKWDTELLRMKNQKIIRSNLYVQKGE